MDWKLEDSMVMVDGLCFCATLTGRRRGHTPFVQDMLFVDHVVLQCPIQRPPHGLHGLTVLDDETIEWLLNTCPEI